MKENLIKKFDSDKGFNVSSAELLSPTEASKFLGLSRSGLWRAKAKEGFPREVFVPYYGSGYLVRDLVAWKNFQLNKEKNKMENFEVEPNYYGRLNLVLANPEVSRSVIMSKAIAESVDPLEALLDYENTVHDMKLAHEKMVRASSNPRINPEESNKVLEHFEAAKKHVIKLVFPEIPIDSISVLDF